MPGGSRESGVAKGHRSTCMGALAIHPWKGSYSCPGPLLRIAPQPPRAREGGAARGSPSARGETQ